MEYSKNNKAIKKKRKTHFSSEYSSALMDNNSTYSRCEEKESPLFDVIPTEFFHIAFGRRN
jgi:hypothetical protein